MNNYFSKNIKYIRECKHLSQTQLASIIDLNQTTIARWEDNTRSPNLSNVIELSERLNIPLPDLICVDMKKDNYESKIDNNKILIENGIMDKDCNINLEKLEIYNKIINYLDNKGSGKDE